MKKYLILFLCLCLFFCGCVNNSVESTSLDSAPTSVSTQPKTKKLEITKGNLIFYFDVDSMLHNLTDTFYITPKTSRVCLHILKSNEIPTNDISEYTNTVQQLRLSSLPNVISTETLHHTVLNTDIEFVEIITDETIQDFPSYWQIGSFHDGSNIYTLEYSNYSKDSVDAKDFSFFLSEIRPCTSLIQLTSASAESLVPNTTVPTEDVKEPAETEPIETKEQSRGSTYVLNTNTKKFHLSECSSAKKMKDANKSIFTGARSDIISKGYSPCGNCNP